MRKNPEIWEKWDSYDSGLSLHPLQIQIASRGLQLPRPGGYLSYSTWCRRSSSVSISLFPLFFFLLVRFQCLLRRMY